VSKAVNMIKLVATIANTVHEIGTYAQPVVEEFIRRRATAPDRPDTGLPESTDETLAKIRAALETAKEGQAVAQAELDALDRKQG
jgi:hypothetical protein